MSLTRALLVVAQATAYQLASTPPNKTPTKARFDSDHAWYIRIAPVVFKLQQPLIWLCTIAELLLILVQQTDRLPQHFSHAIQHTLCLHPQSINDLYHSTHDAPSIYVTPLTTLGVMLIIFGSVLRLTCFSKLGKLFTFDLTILPSHTLITSGPYAYVRHPAYTGTLSMSLGLALINFTHGSWVTECGIVGHGMTGIGIRSMVACAWFGWWVAVGIKRCESEDAELRKMFGKEWDTYASTVRAWFVPGLI